MTRPFYLTLSECPSDLNNLNLPLFPIKTKTKLILVGLLVAVGAIELMGLPHAKITVHIVDEDGKAIPNATVAFTFCGAFNAEAMNKMEGNSDINGNFTGEGRSDGTIGQKITKDGYYWGWAPIPIFYTSKFRMWQPWDQTYTTVLRKVGKPIPMYARRFLDKIPGGLNEPCGYDLEEADWVAPYGKGKIADFFITVTHLKYTDYFNNEMTATISFPNDGDGIQEIKLPHEFANSKFKWPRTAPETGYQPNLEVQEIWSRSEHENKMFNTANGVDGYFLRVRTEEKSGQIVSALYGKIIGGIGAGAGDKDHNGGVGFTYCLNQTPLDRNLEYSGESLFKNLSNEDYPNAP